MSPIILSAKSMLKMQVFWPWSSLRMSACTVPRTVCRVTRFWTRLLCMLVRLAAMLCLKLRTTCWSIAVLKNIAKIIGAGPLMVIETDVLGEHRSKPSYSARISSSVQIDTPALPILP
jgi:hypothetical protein